MRWISGGSGGARRKVVAGLASLAILGTFVPVGMAGADDPPNITSGSGVVPTFVAGNPTCAGLGYDAEFKADPPDAGTYVTPFGSITVVRDGEYFDWTSTFGLDAVIAKGGPNANLYVYDPPAESYGDTHLASPLSGDNPFGLSHISFCYDIELEVTKTAGTTFTRTFQWEIDKSVVPATWDLFTGDSGTSEYTVAVTKTGYVDSDWGVSGTIEVHNPSPSTATVTGVTDSISGFGAVAADCGVSFPYQLAAGGTLVCTYATALPDGASRVNTATATTSGSIGGDSGTADVVFGNPTTVVNGTINVDDTNGASWQFSDTGSVSYTRTFACGADEGQHDNTATIVETGQNDSASVTVDCYDLVVTKDAATALTRTWTWTIDKVADATELLLAEGQVYTINYDVTVDATSQDSGFAVAGDIVVSNVGNPIAATINSVADIVSPGIVASVDCGVTFPYTIPAGGSLACSYDGDLPDAEARLNTATGSLQNYSYDKNLVATPSGTTDYSGTANVDFSGAVITEIDECVNVNDPLGGGFLGIVCAGDAPETFEYSIDVGTGEGNDVVLECGEGTIDNTATFMTNDTGTTGSDSVSIPVSTSCEGTGDGCTLTPGYWKTHSEYGPAPYDDTWALLGPDGADTTFYLSGKTWYQVLWTPPTGGNAYYILAHAYIASYLNVLNGASTTLAVDAALAYADTFFSTASPGTKLSKTDRNTVIAMAGLLDAYNNGIVGPGHCSEDASSAR